MVCDLKMKNKENEVWMGFPWLPVNATLVVWSAEELHLLKGDGAGEAAGNCRMKGKKRVQRSSSCRKSMTPQHQAALIKYESHFLEMFSVL